MSVTPQHYPDRPTNPVIPVALLAVWAGCVALLASQGAFLPPASGLPLPFIPAVLLPVATFMAAHRFVPAVQTWVRRLDLALVAGVQAWRMLGVVFVILWALGRLPTVFALVGGIGDMTVGILAVPAAAAVARQTAGWRTRLGKLIAAGLIDFGVVFFLAVLSAPGLPLSTINGPTPAIMQSLPMAMIPAFGVPMFIILHLIAWIRLRSEVSADRSSSK